MFDLVWDAVLYDLCPAPVHQSLHATSCASFRRRPANVTPDKVAKTYSDFLVPILITALPVVHTFEQYEQLNKTGAA